MRRSHWICLGLAFALAALAAFAEQERGRWYLYRSQTASPVSKLAAMTQRAEWATLNFRFRMRGPRKPHRDIAIIAVDNDSLLKLHQWPWPRSIHALLIQKLSKIPPKALLFDIFFIDPFTSDPRGDRALADMTRGKSWVIHSIFMDFEHDPLGAIEWPYPELRRAAAQLANVNSFPDEDGFLRSAVPQMTVKGQTFTLLSVLGVSVYLNKPVEEVLSQSPRNAKGELEVNFVGKDYTFDYYSYADVLSGAVPASEFSGKIVLVGSRATGTFDHYATPTSSFLPGVEFHANIIDNLLRNQTLRYPGLRYTYIAIALFGLFFGILLVRTSAWAGALWALGTAGLYMVLAQWLFNHKNITIDMAGPLLTLGLVYVAIVIYRFFTEEREKRMVKSFFSQQVSGELLDVLMNDPGVLKRSGERREMTVFFSDVAAFTSISERLQPEELVELLNRYLTAMTEVIFENGGYVDKYMGDGIMAFWNGLLKQPDHAERACRCALGSVKRLEELNHDFKTRGLVSLDARIGINTGAMAAGYMGSVQKRQFTVMGDNVNLGSRLEGANKAFGSSVMISEFTYEMVQDKFEVRFLDKIRVPGKAKPVKVFELLAEKGALAPQWQKSHALYHEAIMLFVNREFAKAREKFLEVSTILGQDKASMAYVHRAEEFMAHPPPGDWDGVFEVKSK